MIEGEPPFDVLAVDSQRFDKWMTRDHAIAMARELYGFANGVHYPKDGTEQFVHGRPSQRASTIFEKLKKRGAQYGFLSGKHVALLIKFWIQLVKSGSIRAPWLKSQSCLGYVARMSLKVSQF